MPWFGILDVIRQSVFYVNLLVFWVTLPHHYIEKERAQSALKRRTWMIFFAAMPVCLTLPICERAARLHNPFRPLNGLMDIFMYLSIGYIFIAGLYFFLLCYTIRQALYNTISDNSSIFAPSTPGIVWRFRLLMLVTLPTAAISIIRFLIGQLAQGAYKWDEDLGQTLEYSGALETGVYGMWNIHVFSLIFLFAPTHNQGAYEMGLTNSEEIDDSHG